MKINDEARDAILFLTWIAWVFAVLAIAQHFGWVNR